MMKRENYLGQRRTWQRHDDKVAADITSPYQLKNTSLSADGGSFYCSRALGTPSGAGAAMCNLQGPEFFSRSAADMVMAARFGKSYAPSIAADLKQTSSPGGGNDGGLPLAGCLAHGDVSPASPPQQCSTEANTPWMMADYFITLHTTELKGDTEKGLHAEAQVDLLLCGDPDCNEVADIQRIVAPGMPNTDGGSGSDTSILALGFSTLLSTVVAIPQGTAGDVMFNTGKPVNFTSSGGSKANITQVQYTVKRANYYVTGPEPWIDPVSLAAFARLLGPKLTAWPLQYGAYRATQLYHEFEPNLTGMEDGDEACVIIVLPANNTWMSDHGWNLSDSDCMQRINDTTPVFIFDSYFYQAHFWGGRSQVLAHEDIYTDRYTPRLKNITIRMKVPVDQPVRDGSSLNVPLLPDWEGTSHLYAGDFGLTSVCDGALALNRATGEECNMFNTQTAVTGCFVGNVKGPQYDCVVLAVGTATILVRPVAHLWATGNINLPFVWQSGDNSTSSMKLLPLGIQNDEAIKAGKYPQQPPWCGLPIDDTFMHDFMFRDDQCFLQRYGDRYCINLIDVFLENLTLKNGDGGCFPRSLMRDCDYWDSNNIGMAHPIHEKGNTVPNRPLPELFRRQWQDFEGRQLDLGPARAKQQAPYPYSRVLGRRVSTQPMARFMKQSIEAVVLDAARLLEDRVAVELSSADATLSVVGGLAILALTFVAAVAMCKGWEDVEDVFSAVFNYVARYRCWHWMSSGEALGHAAVKLMTCGVVATALLMPPILSFVNYYRAMKGSNPMAPPARWGGCSQARCMGKAPLWWSVPWQ